MIILDKFKEYLLSQKNPPSRITVKNYLSDIRKFILWLEDTTESSFSPKKVDIDTIKLFSHSLKKNNFSEVSIKRYMSSLKKFYEYLLLKRVVNQSPFENEKIISHTTTDPILLNDFRDFLLTSKLSRVSIKNYMLDIKQFIYWLEEVIPDYSKKDEKIEVLKKLDPFVVEEYKNRLYHGSGLAAVSVNRKLSSIRRYLSWMGDKNIIIKTIPDLKRKKTVNTINQNKKSFQDSQAEINQKIHENINLIKATDNPILEEEPGSPWDSIIDRLIAMPTVSIIGKIEYFGWLIQGRNVFRKSKVKQSNIQNTKIFNISSYIKKRNIHNVSKAAYAPLSISLDGLPKYKKFLFHLRHSRPNWYKIYHSYPISDYFHVGILVIFTTIFGSTIYFALNGGLKQSNAVFASPASTSLKKLYFQGTLTDKENNPITSETALRFAIYNNSTATGSALLWQEVQNITPDENGNFSAQIGLENPLPASVFYENPSLYLGMTVATGDELKPRHALATVGYSKNAEKLQGLTPITQAGAGSSNVVLALDSAGNLTIGGKASPTFQATEGQFTISGNTLLLNSTEGSDSNIVIAPDGQGFVDIQKPIQNTTKGINLSGVPGAVEIDDLLSILATASAQSALTINQNGTGPIISASTSGIAKFLVDSHGSGFFGGDIALNGTNLNSSAENFNLLNDKVLSLNIAGKATSISIGAATGATKINNTLLANGGLTVAANRSLIISGNVASDIIPFAASTYNLGSPTMHWNNAFIDNLYTNPTASVSGFWQRKSGTLSPLNTTDDLLIGGSSSDSSKFQIIGSGAYAGTASTSGQLTFNKSSQINLLNNGNLAFYNSAIGDNGIDTANPSLFIASNKNIGIGTNNPSAKLEVNGDIKSQAFRVTSGGIIRFDNSSGDQISSINSIDLGSSGSALTFSTKSSGLMERMRLDQNGNLILGGQIATAALDVHANSAKMSIASFSGSTNFAGLVVDNSGPGDIFTASSSGLSRFVIGQNGNVGIGDVNPENTLKVFGSLCVNSSTGACAGTNPGTIYAANTSLQSADVAENYISAQNLEAGDIIMPEGKENTAAVVKTDRAYQSQTIGIVSTKPGITLNSEAKQDHEYPYILPIALAGRVPVKVTSENGPIRSGDFITTSSLPGVGMKASKAGVVIGKALETYNDPDPRKINKITVFVNLSYFDPRISTGYVRSYNSEDNIGGNISLNYLHLQSAFENINDGFIQVQKLTNDSLGATFDNIAIGGQTLKEYVTLLVENIIKKQIEERINSVALETSQTGQTQDLKIISPLASDSAIAIKTGVDQISIINPKLSSTSAVAVIDNMGNASFSGTLRSQGLNTNEATISGSLHVHNLIADNINSGSSSATYITNVTNIYNQTAASVSAAPIASNSGVIAINTASASAESLNSTPEATTSAGLDNKALLDLISKNQDINNDYANLSSLSGQLAYTPNLNSSLAHFPAGMIVYGPTTLSDTAIAGNLNVGGGLILSNNSINTLGSDLALEPLRQGNLSIMGGLVFIDTEGNLKAGGNAEFAKNVSVKGNLAVNIIAPVPDADLVIKLGDKKQAISDKEQGISDRQELMIKNSSNSGVLAVNQSGDLTASGTGAFARLAAGALNIVHGAQADTSLTETVASTSAGTAVITEHETERTIVSPFMNNDSLIYLTATSDTQGLTPFVARQTENSFTIAIPYSINKEIKINWWIVN